MTVSKPISVSELTLEELFGGRLTDTVCVNIHHGREVWVATLMCAEYLETFVDSIIVRDDSFKPVGVVGGIELLDNLRENPTRDFQYNTRISDVMMTDFTRAEKTTRFSDLMDTWKSTGRAFSIMLNEYGDCSTVSARRMVGIGTRCRGNVSISSLQRRKAVTFRQDSTLGEVLDRMYRYNVRKLLLEDSTQFISDRMILGEISKLLRHQPEVDYFLNMPINRFPLADAREIKQNLNLNHVCSLMETMDHPVIIYHDMVLTPWDVCIALLSEDVYLPGNLEQSQKRICPHCGKALD